MIMSRYFLRSFKLHLEADFRSFIVFCGDEKTSAIELVVDFKSIIIDMIDNSNCGETTHCSMHHFTMVAF